MINPRSRKRTPRTGGAVVEAALTLPLLLLLITATVELSSAIYLKESLTIAAYEGAREAITRKGTTESVEDRIERVFTDRSITTGTMPVSARVTVSPSPDEAEKMEPVTVTVTAPTAGNIIVPLPWLQFVTPPELSATVIMRKEFTLEQ